MHQKILLTHINLAILTIPFFTIACGENDLEKEKAIPNKDFYFDPLAIDYQYQLKNLTYIVPDESKQNNVNSDANIKILWTNQDKLVTENPLFWKHVTFEMNFSEEKYNLKYLPEQQSNKLNFLCLSPGKWNLDVVLDRGQKTFEDYNGQLVNYNLFWKTPSKPGWYGRQFTIGQFEILDLRVNYEAKSYYN